MQCSVITCCVKSLRQDHNSGQGYFVQIWKSLESNLLKLSGKTQDAKRKLPSHSLILYAYSMTAKRVCMKRKYLEFYTYIQVS